jgi:predicted nucleic acid-binding protein
VNFVVVDASVWVARLVPQDIFHSPVKVWMETQRVSGTGFLSPALLLTEAAGEISRRTGDALLAQKAVESLERLPALRLISMDSPLLRSAARLAADLGLRGADAVYVAVAAHLSAPLLTLDKDQRTRAAQVVSLINLPPAI